MEMVATDMHDSAIEETPAPPPGRLLSDHFVRSPGYYGYRMAGTRDWLITYTRAGEGCFRLEGFVYICQPGDLVLLAPGVPHDYAASNAERPWDFYWAHFLPHPHWSAWLLQLPQLRPGFYVVVVSDPTIKARAVQAFERLVYDNRTLRSFQEDLALAALEEILILAAQQSAIHAEKTLDPRIERLLQHMSCNLSEPLSVPQLAEMVALSPSRLAHLFKEQAGDSIAAMHLKLRLRHAARLLAFTSQQINEIAQLTGFHSPFHFSRQFKAHYGLNPTAYRESQITTS